MSEDKPIPDLMAALRASLERAKAAREGRMPQRIQRRRTKGWRMPEGAIYVGRPTDWGNPFVANKTFEGDWAVTEPDALHRTRAVFPDRASAVARAVELFRRSIGPIGSVGLGEVRALRGKDLVCWCALDQPCHADVLLEIANGPAETRTEDQERDEESDG